jgi:hypothetical protein
MGANNKPERATEGIITQIRRPSSGGHTFDFADTGGSWLTDGEQWFDDSLEVLFRKGRPEKLGLCGSQALLGINRLAKAGGQVNLRPMSASYGLKVVEWVTPFGTVYLMVHPLFSNFGPDRKSMLVLEPSRLRFRHIDDTFYKTDNSERENTNNSKDSTDEEFVTEAGLEWEHTPTMGYLTNVGA